MLQIMSSKFWIKHNENSGDMCQLTAIQQFNIKRSILVETLQNNSLWWKGPLWLIYNSDWWPIYSIPIYDVPEIRTVKLVFTVIQNIDNSLVETQYHWIPIIRITTWVLRFVNNRKIQFGSKLSIFWFLTELQTAQLVWFQVTQRASFYREFQDLKQGKQVSRNISWKHWIRL